MMRRSSRRSRCSSESSAGNSSRAARSPDAPSTTSVGLLLIRLPSGLGGLHVSGHVAEQAGVEDAFREPPRAVDALEPVVVLAGQDGVQALTGDLEHGKAAPGGCVVIPYPDRHVRDLVLGAGRAVLVDHDAVVDRAGLAGAAPAAVVAGRADLGVLEQRGDAVEVAGVETERVLVDQRLDLVPIVGGAAHACVRIGTDAQPRTLPEGTRVQPASSITYPGIAARISSRLTRISRRASAAPRHTWMPWPNPRCCTDDARSRRYSSGRSQTRSSRFPDPRSSSTFAPSGIRSPWRSTGRVSVRAMNCVDPS